MTWTAFQEQYEARGREKAEGYFPFHFEGMTAAELDRARRMLEARGAQGDTTDIDGLRLIGDDQSVARLIAAEPGDTIYGMAFETARRETLFALTGAAAHLAPLLEGTDGGNQDDAALAAQALGRHPLPATLAAPIEGRIADGRHDRALIWLVKAWLSTQGVPIWRSEIFDQQVPFIRAVTQARPGRRAALLADWRAGSAGRLTP